jgi:spore germination protein KB
MRKGLTIAAVMLLLVVLRDTVVLGKFISILSMPSYYSARYINIGNVLTRVEIIYAIVLVALMFFKVSVVYYAGASGLRQLLETQSYGPYVYILGALICIYAAGSFPTNSEHVRWKMTTAATFSTFFILVLPLLTLLVSLIREGVSTKVKVSETQ